MDKIEIVILKEYHGITIKEFLKKNHVGRAKIESIRVNKDSFLNNQYASLETIVHENDKLSIRISENIDFFAENGDLYIVYEDDYLLAVNKPCNMIIHPDGNMENKTLVNYVANYYQKNGIRRKVRYLHRIDKETTGLVLFAKDFLTEAIMLQQFEENKVDKCYLAFVENGLPSDKGTIKFKIGKDRHINSKMCVAKIGKDAITKYEVIEKNADYSLVLFKLITGRTHQIRVHSSYFHAPLLGDVLYGGNYQYINRVALHSYKLEFIHPISKEKIEIVCPLTDDLEKLRENNEIFK